MADFQPVSLLDISSIRFCTFCFKATDFKQVHQKSCSIGQITQPIPTYWPPNWNNVKCVNFKSFSCYLPGCKKQFNSSKRMELFTHLNSRLQHAECLRTDEEQSEIVDVSSIRTQSVEVTEIKPSLVIDDLMNTEVEDVEAEEDEAREDEEDAAVSFAIKEEDIQMELVLNEEYDSIDCKKPCEFPLVSAQPIDSQSEEVLKTEPVEFKDCFVTDSHDATTSSSSKSRPNKHSHFKCGYCKYITSKSNVIKRHYKQNHETKLLYLCEPCFFVSHCKYTYLKHWRCGHASDPEQLLEAVQLDSLEEECLSEEEELVVHNETNYNSYVMAKTQKIVKCKFCPYKTSYRKHLVVHISSSHYTSISETLVNVGDDTRTYQCITCSANTESKLAAAKHYVSNHVRFHMMRCDLCEVDLKDKTYFSSHLKGEKHREFYRRSLRCPNCQFATLSKKALQKHQSVTHSTAKPRGPRGPRGKGDEFACDKCKYVSKFKANVNCHKKKVHGMEKDEDGFYKCGECDFKTSNKGKLVYHNRSAPNHTVAKNCVRCDICDWAALNNTGMIYHKRMIHGRSE